MGSPAPDLGNESKTEDTDTTIDTTTASPATADGQDSAAE